MDGKIKIEKGSVQETLIIPLYARKKCTDKFPDLYTDPVADEIERWANNRAGEETKSHNRWVNKTSFDHYDLVVM